VIIRKKDNYDGAQPSANAMMCYNLLYLANMFDLPVWQLQAQNMLSAMQKRMLQYPSSFSVWAQAYAILVFGFTELISIGNKARNAIMELQATFLPYKMLLISDVYDPSLPLVKGKQLYENQYFICHKGTCSVPFTNLNDFLTTIKQTKF
jgi:uncharacterized protein YyaL (SSP411 family)